MHNVIGPSARSATEEVYNHINLSRCSSSSAFYPKEWIIAVREPAPCLRPIIDVPFQNNDDATHVNQRSLPPVCQKKHWKFRWKLFHYDTQENNSWQNDPSIKRQIFIIEKNEKAELLYINSNEVNRKKMVKQWNSIF